MQKHLNRGRAGINTQECLTLCIYKYTHTYKHIYVYIPLTSCKMLFPLKVKILCIATHQTDPNDGFWVDQEMKGKSYFLFHIFLIQVCLFFFFSNRDYDFGT